MAIYKCKMCGGALEITTGASVIECDYCGTQQTLPRLDDNKRVNMYDRANHFRRNNEFDKAMGIYEQILNEDRTDAEAYWSLVLCCYGIEYVEDPISHKRVPTINRTQFTSIFDDDNYKSALQYADSYQRTIYEEEAKTINEIQKDILAISQKEEPFDVFICYKESDNSGRRTPDSVLAQDLYFGLKNEGFKVFFSRITLEDKLGSAYEPYIFAALNSSKVMIVLGTRSEFFNAVWVKNEWRRYLALIKQGQKKVLIPAYKDMDPYDLPEEFSHLQAQDMSKLGFMQDLIRGIRKLTQENTPTATTVVKETVVQGSNVNTVALLKRAYMFLEDGDWQSANEYCEKVLDLDPESAEAYLGMLMAQLHVKTREKLANYHVPFDHYKNYQKAIRFATGDLKNELEKYIRNIRDKQEKRQREKKDEQKYYGELSKQIKTIWEKYGDINERKNQLHQEMNEIVLEKEELENLVVSFSEQYRIFVETEDEINRLRANIISLQREKETLGLFAIKRRRELDKQICELNSKIEKRIEDLEPLKKTLRGYTSVENIESRINHISQMILEKQGLLDELMDVMVEKEKLISIFNENSSGWSYLNELKQEIFKMQCAKGSLFTFGKYEGINIEWIVLDIRDDMVLLLSKDVLVCREYALTTTYTSWKHCHAQKWLHESFIKSAFSYEEEKAIIPTIVREEESDPVSDYFKRDRYHADGYKLFLLSSSELTRYLISDNIKKCAHIKDKNSYYRWWLRSKGVPVLDGDDASSVDTDGTVNKLRYANAQNIGIRPAMWVDLLLINFDAMEI